MEVRRKYQHSVIGGRMHAWTVSRQPSFPSSCAIWISGTNSRRKHAALMASALADSAVIPPELPAAGEHVFHLFVVRTPQRNALRCYLRANGIATGIHYPVPLHLTEAYQQLGYGGEKAPCHGGEQLAKKFSAFPCTRNLQTSKSNIRSMPS